VSRRRRHILTGLLIVVCVVLVITLSGSSEVATPRLDRLNELRVNHGVRPLDQKDGLQEIANDWADHLAATGVLIHNPKLAVDVCCYQTVGENVGYGPDWLTVFQAFMDSPEHKANMLDPIWHTVGIGHQLDANGTAWIVIVFKDPT
jgi:uncharacterized protein YkwD